MYHNNKQLRRETVVPSPPIRNENNIGRRTQTNFHQSSTARSANTIMPQTKMDRVWEALDTTSVVAGKAVEVRQTALPNATMSVSNIPKLADRFPVRICTTYHLLGLKVHRKRPSRHSLSPTPVAIIYKTTLRIPLP